MYAAGARFGPFRFQALKTLEVKDFHLSLTEREQGRSSAAAVREGVEKLSEKIAMQTRAARVSVQDFHLDIHDEDGKLRCCLEAEHASWGSESDSDIELDRSVQITTDGRSWHAPRALIRTGEAMLMAPGWTASPGQEGGRHSEPRSLQTCPLFLAQDDS
jgi:hypothetical protein